MSEAIIQIIQGGMGVGVSNWTLARAVSELGQLGVVSGTGMDNVFVRRLQDGDLGSHLRRALDHFPKPELAQRIFKKYFLAEGRNKKQPYVTLPTLSASSSSERAELLVLGNFCEVFLAKEEHSGKVGLNLLEKIQTATLPCLYGALLAGIDYVLMGAGIPMEIPGVLQKLADHKRSEITLDVMNGEGETFKTSFDPSIIVDAKTKPLQNPKFLPIVSSLVLAQALMKKANGPIHGFVVENPTAGGHNAPPRGEMHLNEKGEPLYSERDVVDFERFKKLGVPFWIAGGMASREGFLNAVSKGAEGIQIGTAFAFCEESGLRTDLKTKFLNNLMRDQIEVFTDPKASPTGFPFKIAQLEGTLSDSNLYQQRPRRCDLGYLRQIYKRADGSLGYRCPAEPVDHFVLKGGQEIEAHNRKCLCNALMANVGYGQTQPNSYMELPLLTTGDDIHAVKKFLRADKLSYKARDVLDSILT